MPEHDGGGAMLAFAGFYPLPDDGLIGAAMVTNERGYPQEFRLSASVRPSRMQRALHGGLLRSYLVEVVGPPLLDALETPFGVVIANCPEALTLPCPAPLAYARADDRAPSGGSRFEVRRVELGGVSVMAEAAAGVFPILQQVAERVDPLDAFRRMDAARGALAERDAG